ncbi:MAG: hypothetical protein ACP5UA_02015 [Candidatus Hydrogenedens sp.]
MLTSPPIIVCSEQGREIAKGVKGEGTITVRDNPHIFYFETDTKGRRVTPQPSIDNKEFNCLFFGCSFTFGTGVNNDQTLPYYFGQLHPEIEVYNYGIPGGSPQEIYLQSTHSEIFADIPTKPTIVIYTFISDHLRRLKGTINLIFRAPKWVGCLPELEIVNTKVINKGKFEKTHPYLFSFANIISNSLVIKQMINYTQMDYPSPFTNENYDFLCNLLNETRNQLSIQFPNLYFVIFIYPEHCFTPNTCPNLDYFINILNMRKELMLISCEEKKMIENYSQLKSSGKHIILDGHPSPECYKLFAEWISNGLKNKGIIP